MRRSTATARVFEPMHIFEPARTFRVSVDEVGAERHPVLTVDRFYRRPARVRRFFRSIPAAIWKTVPGSRNFQDFYDCRHHIHLAYGLEPLIATLAGLIEKVFGLAVTIDPAVVTNVFQLIHDQPPGTTAFPHHDIGRHGIREQPVNALVYLNTPSEARGGTALYRHRASGRESMPIARARHDAFHRRYIDQPGIREDGATYWCEYGPHWEPFHLIEMRFNRLAIFPSQIFHGAWHQRSWFKRYPRLTQVFFPRLNGRQR